MAGFHTAKLEKVVRLEMEDKMVEKLKVGLKPKLKHGNSDDSMFA